MKHELKKAEKAAKGFLMIIAKESGLIKLMDCFVAVFLKRF